jgi:hypothetical protein
MKLASADRRKSNPGTKSKAREHTQKAWFAGKSNHLHAAHFGHFTRPVWPIFQPQLSASDAALLAHSSIGSLGASSKKNISPHPFVSHMSCNSQ